MSAIVRFLKTYYIALYAILCIFIVINRSSKWKNNILRFDNSGYYLYLPAVFIYDDLRSLSFYNGLDSVYRIADVPYFGLTPMPGGNMLNKYSTGVALMELPFFLIAHLYTTVNQAWPADGYSLPYQYGVIFAVIFWGMAGLWVLKKFLHRYFSNDAVLVTITCLSIGTNFYYFTAFNQGGSHIFSFFLAASLLYVTDSWYRHYQYKHACLLGITLGLIAIVRPVNILVIIIPLLWKVDSLTVLKERIKLLLWEWRKLLLIALSFLAVVSIQLAYWKLVTGSWVYYAYGGEHFVWSEPRVLDGLFSYRKGWFVYTPIAFVAFAGFFFLRRRVALPLLLFYPIIIFVTFSWWCWWYGGGFGCRPMVDFLPLLALPFAALYSGVATRKKGIRVGFSIVLSALIALNLFQSYQFSIYVLNDAKMTKAYYWRAFGKLKMEEKDYDLLLDDRTYWKEMGRIDRK